MMAGRWVAPLAAEFPRMNSTLEAVDLPEDLDQDSQASGQGNLRSSLCCRDQLLRLVDHGLCSSQEGGRDPDSLEEDLVQEGRQEVQEVLLDRRGHGELLGVLA